MEFTTEQIEQIYKSSFDSIKLIKEYSENPPSNLSAEEIADTIERNKKHLKIILAYNCWTNEDLTPLQEVSN